MTSNPLSGKSRALPANAVRRGNGIEFDEDEDDSDSDGAINAKRRRNGNLRKRAKKSKVSKRNVGTEDGEYFNLDGQPDNNDNDEDQKDDGAMDHQLNYYKGDMKKLVLIAVFLMRMFLLNMNAYPEKAELINWGRKVFNAACQMTLGINYKGIV